MHHLHYFRWWQSISIWTKRVAHSLTMTVENVDFVKLLFHILGGWSRTEMLKGFKCSVIWFTFQPSFSYAPSNLVRCTISWLTIEYIFLQRNGYCSINQLPKWWMMSDDARSPLFSSQILNNQCFSGKTQSNSSKVNHSIKPYAVSRSLLPFQLMKKPSVFHTISHFFQYCLSILQIALFINYHKALSVSSHHFSYGYLR